MKKMINPNITTQMFRLGAVTGTNYTFFPNKATEVNDADVDSLLAQGFVIFNPIKKNKRRK